MSNQNDGHAAIENQLLKSRIATLEQLIEVYEKSVLEKTDELYAEIAKRRRAEEALIRIQKAVESSSDAIGMSDPQGCHFYHNKAFHDLFEYSVEELNKPLAPVVIYADPNVGREVFETIMQGNPWVGEIIMVAKSGRRFPVFLRADAVKDDNGNIIGLIGIHTDITERKRAEEALLASEAQFKAQYQGSPIPTFTWKKKEETFQLVDYNQAAKVAGKGEVTKYLGKNVGEIYRDRPEILESMHRCFTENKVMQREVQSQHFMPGRTMIVTYAFVPPDLIMTHAQDITARKLAEEALRQSEERYRTMMEEMEEWYFENDLAGNIIFSNDAFANVLGYSQKELTGLNFRSFIKKEELDLVYKLFNQVFKTGKSTKNIPYEFIRTDGKVTPGEFSIFPKQDKEGKVCGFKGVGHDITERKRAGEKIQHLATHDTLTELPNRSMFSQLLNHAIQAAKRYQRQFAVLFIDLDRFKIINDTLGHEAGDQLLQEIATRLKQTLRAVDVAARLGGDEFVILIEEVSDSNHVAIVARKILASIINPITLVGQECRITASIGICMYPKDAEDEQSLMKNADIAMYLAKEEGKNNYQFYSEDIRSKSLERLSIETNLRFALERNELSLHYQAKVDFKTNTITGVEALLRWQNPYLGSVTPTQFIPVAEETGLIVSIGKWVMQTACAQNVAWQQQGLPAVCMAVNLSLRQLTDDNLIDNIKTALNDSGMAPNLLELEITESMVMHNPTRMISILAKIKSMGVRLAIDDFGTGYASLAQIKHFPVDTLKVDRAFIRNIPQAAEDKAITEAIIAMGKTLSLTVVAEGVETVEQMNFLKEHSCDEMQGFYFSKPIMPEQFADLLRKQVPSPLKRI